MRFSLLLIFLSTMANAQSSRSLFDHKFPETIPFPFEKLIAEAGGKAKVTSVLVPLGRSLQRRAGAPEVFRFPRVVAALEGDQIFLGYNEKANILEVISYNEEAGRFEFQVVHDYGKDMKPRVLYARRESCVACHQNQAPIFSQAPWDETQANPLVSVKLKQQVGKIYQGIPTSSTQDPPYDFDTMTDRANMISVYQEAWSRLCTSNSCRRDIFKLLMEMRLSGLFQIKHPSQDFQQRWHKIWPNDLPIPNPDIPNRNPLDLKQSLEQMLEVGSEYEPLNLRPPLEVWNYSRENVIRLFSGLAVLISDADIQSLKGKDVMKAIGKMSEASFAPPFNRTRLFTELFHRLDMEYPKQKSDWGPKQYDQSSQFLKSIEQQNQVGVFRRCASCHNNTMGFPANFLYGKPDEVKRKIAHCSERILYRLAMWHLPSHLRGKTPMPPSQSLEIREEDWEQSKELKMIEDYVKKQLMAEKQESAKILLKNFDQLRPCLESRVASLVE